MFVGNDECFGVWPRHDYFLTLFEGGLLCVRN
jgi:hypothetical protein